MATKNAPWSSAGRKPRGVLLNSPKEAAILAEMLGCTRHSVTIVAGTLQRAGMIHYKRGEITVLDRAGLEEAACECYREIQRFYRDTVRVKVDESAR